MKLKQVGTVEQYQESFDALLNRVELSANHAISCFLGGLCEEIQSAVRMFKPQTIHDAYCLAKLQEATLVSIAKKTKPILERPPSFSRSITSSYRNFSKNPQSFTSKDYPSSSHTTTRANSLQPASSAQSVTSKPRNSRRILSAKEIEEKRAKNLCFFCDEKFFPGHKCNAQVYQLEILKEDSEELGEDEGLQEEGEGEVVKEEDMPLISLHALNGASSYQTMRVNGKAGNATLHILIDSGSTHNFLDISVAKKLHCELRKIPPLPVAIANGQQLDCNIMCKDFSWSLIGQEFTADMLLVPLGSCEMVLGVQWLSTLGPILWDFEALKMEFSYKGKRVLIRGTKKSVVEWMSGKKVHKAMNHSAQLFTLQLRNVEQLATHNNPTTQVPQLSALLKEFADLFEEPRSLPPHRSHDHKIILKPGTSPVNVRPYRYPALQKDVIEKTIQEMLEAGVVRPSQSPYSSPIVLVKKKDGTWRLCVDYRQLNKHTVLDKFPIPVIEELLDELFGASYFSKIDLRAGYWQVRMNPHDVEKTAFRTHDGHYEFLVMPFGLTNAPSTFQSLMNHIFRPYLRKFILVFFDDILIYSPSLEAHLLHLRTAFETLRQHSLFAKMSKCSFGTREIEYLGHVISKDGVSTDQKKIEAMKGWPTPCNVKQLRGFLGLTGYYRRFIRNYGQLSRPLTELLKKEAFHWSDEAQLAFENLKLAMITAPVLALPDFTKPFVLETDASGAGIGAVLMQEDHPIAYLNKALSLKHQSLSTYERELMAVVMAVEKWRPYLLGRHFLIKTDHFSLKYIMEQKITTPFQSKWLPRLMGFDYEISYKQGRDNQAADGLSRISGAQLLSMTISNLQTDLLDQIKASWSQDSKLQQLIQKLSTGQSHPKYQWSQGLLFRKGKLVVGNHFPSQQQIIQLFHDTPLGGHSGVKVTKKKLSSLFYWKGVSRNIRNYIRSCDTCQRNKADLGAPAGLLQPLPIPGAIWVDVSIDFIEGLPKSRGKDTILVVVDRLSKYAHFLALAHPFTAAVVAQLYFEHIFKLHGLPKTIVSDRDKIFLSSFWQELFTLQQVDLHMSTAYHPQSDGQTEVVNRCLEGYLRCMTGEKPVEWVLWLPLAEWWYNTNWHSSIGLTPYEVVYGQPPSLHIPYVSGDSKVEAVDRSLKAREDCIRLLRFHLTKSQQRMKAQADKHRSERAMEVGDWVFVKLQPYRQQSVAQRTNHKLAAKFFGPFQVISKVGSVAYKLQLPSHSKIHPVFHVSQLKKKVGSRPTSSTLPEVDDQGLVAAEPVAVLDRRLGKVGNSAAVYVLIQWSHAPKEEATWELYSDIERRFPQFQLEA